MSRPAPKRFPAVAHTVEEAVGYYRNRAVQALRLGWRWDGAFIDHGWGVEVVLTDPDDQPNHSVFVLADHTGRGHLSRWMAAHPDARFVTSTLCPKMKAWLEARGTRHVTISPPPWPAYAAIERFYGDRCARRSGLFLMNHIDEGLFVLERLAASAVERDGWCLHPLVQGDAELQDAWRSTPDPLAEQSPRAVLLAMAYRETANGYLSTHPPSTPVPRSPLSAVQRLLVADKVQNRKDFERHLRGRVPNSDRLDAYFADWLAVLGVSEARYLEWATAIVERSGRGRPELITGADGRRHLAPVDREA